MLTVLLISATACASAANPLTVRGSPAGMRVSLFSLSLGGGFRMGLRCGNDAHGLASFKVPEDFREPEFICRDNHDLLFRAIFLISVRLFRFRLRTGLVRRRASPPPELIGGHPSFPSHRFHQGRSAVPRRFQCMFSAPAVRNQCTSRASNGATIGRQATRCPYHRAITPCHDTGVRPRSSVRHPWPYAQARGTRTDERSPSRRPVASPDTLDGPQSRPERAKGANPDPPLWVRAPTPPTAPVGRSRQRRHRLITRHGTGRRKMPPCDYRARRSSNGFDKRNSKMSLATRDNRRLHLADAHLPTHLSAVREHR